MSRDTRFFLSWTIDNDAVCTILYILCTEIYQPWCHEDRKCVWSCFGHVYVTQQLLWFFDGHKKTWKTKMSMTSSMKSVLFCVSASIMLNFCNKKCAQFVYVYFEERFFHFSHNSRSFVCVFLFFCIITRPLEIFWILFFRFVGCFAPRVNVPVPLFYKIVELVKLCALMLD